MLKKEQTLVYYIKSEIKNRILFIHVNRMEFNCICCKQELEDPEIQAAIDKGLAVNILYDFTHHRQSFRQQFFQSCQHKFDKFT